MAVKQISVFLENKPGKLAEFTDVLSKNNINLRAMNLADGEDFGIVRLIVDDVYNASTILKDANYVSSVKDVLAVKLSDEPGSLAKVLKVLGDNDVNLQYMYAFTTHTAGTANMIIRATDNQRAAEVLSANGISQIDQDELAKM